MLIRKAHDNEYDMIKKQRLASYAAYKHAIPEGHWNVLKGTLSSENVKDSGAEIYVSEINGDIAGSVVLFPSKTKAYEWDSQTLEYPEIRMLAVDASFRGNGIGKALVQHCIKQAKEDGSTFVGLHTANFMENAMRLYEKLGFRRIPALDFEPLDDGIVVKAFRLDLNS
ncbi:GNAT family N-acetyltransferase [Planococcus shenhongbingii]|uniref:GNAT family N-acetyltransferase n=1 Tax=Planococcus shenhongbingii TaxID=3058398 RepID=UPI0026099E9D|nr:GNAT family N-acetyltransferase [Planococcus sp. N016]WKA59507.1 GNAT family N-acetyltransferase [Planococcus sp. N016]